MLLHLEPWLSPRQEMRYFRDWRWRIGLGAGQAQLWSGCGSGCWSRKKKDSESASWPGWVTSPEDRNKEAREA